MNGYGGIPGRLTAARADAREEAREAEHDTSGMPNAGGRDLLTELVEAVRADPRYRPPTAP